jgi:hypothetical protein
MILTICLRLFEIYSSGSVGGGMYSLSASDIHRRSGFYKIKIKKSFICHSNIQRTTSVYTIKRRKPYSSSHANILNNKSKPCISLPFVTKFIPH